jgi:drug/metabolite transporter (DMT)-like permease
MIFPSWRFRIFFWVIILGWGWGWVGIRDSLHYFNPGQLALGRYCIASLTLIPFLIKQGIRFPQRSDLPLLLLAGLLGFTLYNLFINTGQKTITAAEAALLASCLPILTALGASFFFKEHLNILGWVGVVIAFFGVSLMTLQNSYRVQCSYGSILVFTGIVCAASYALLIKKILSRYSPLEVTAWTMWIGTIGLIPSGSGIFSAVAHAPTSVLIMMLFLGVVPGALCYVLFAFLTAHVPIAKVVNLKFFIPIVTVLLGWLLLKEIPSWMVLIGGTITLIGAYLVHYEKK